MGQVGYRQERRYCPLYRTSGIVFCGELRSCYISSVNWGRCIWRTEEFVSPELPKHKSFGELKELLVSHYLPKPILITERFKFHRRNQLGSETVAQFVVELKQLALKCEFGSFWEKHYRTVSFVD